MFTVPTETRTILKLITSKTHLTAAATRSWTYRPRPLQRPISTTPRPASAAPLHTTPTVTGALRRGLTSSSQHRRSQQDLRMAGDDEYMDFLNKANEDPGRGSVKAQNQGKKELKAADKGVDIPQPLVAATKDAFYVSDSDEPFVPVSLGWSKGEGLPDEEELAKLVDHWEPSKAEVEIMDPVDWDRNGQYKEIIDAVSKAGKGNDVRVYRITKDASRVEYFVITRQGDGKDARLVGVKALSIES